MTSDQRERVIDTIVNCSFNADKEFLSKRSDEALIEVLQVIARSLHFKYVKEDK